MSTWNSPPNWPAPPPGWTPPPGWQPDPAWGPAPPGWNFGTAAPNPGPAMAARRKTNGRTLKIVGGVLGLFVLASCVGAIAGGGDSDTVDTAQTEASTAPSAAASKAPVASKAPAAPPSAAAPVEPEQAELSGAQENAVRSAEAYLQVAGFSRDSLINQLVEFDKYEKADATAAVDSMDIDYIEQATKSAEAYLQVTGFSRQALIDQLTGFDKYTQAQATAGADAALG
jgi:hypothetical protein